MCKYFLFVFACFLTLRSYGQTTDSTPPSSLPPKTSKSLPPSVSKPVIKLLKDEVSPTEQPLKVNQNQLIKVEYKFTAWNKNPQVIDVASLLIRDSFSGKVAKIELTETDFNSSSFKGSFYFALNPDSDFFLEIYNVPLSEKLSMGQLLVLIKDGTAVRKPYFLRSFTTHQFVNVFDTTEQALSAQVNYRKALQGREVVDRAALEAQAQAQRLIEQKRLADLAKLQENARLQLEAEERKRKEELKKQQEMMDAAKKAELKAQAQRLGSEADKKYAAENYKEAETLYEQASKLDHENQSLYFKYGVSLFRLEKHNKALVVLKMANGPGVNSNERDYFVALCHLKLKEYDTARKEFADLKSKNDEMISPSSAFYAGVIDFQKENYDQAKDNFQYTLDTSKDPALDAQAESYIEQIAAILAFEAESKKKFLLSFSLGFGYDSNITTASNTQVDLGLATGNDGFRFSHAGGFEWRPIYKINHEASFKFNVNNLYSVNNKFSADNTVQNADPLLLTLAIPYKYKGLVFGKGYQMTITPGFDLIYLNVSATEDGLDKRELVSDSTYGKWDHTFVMNDDWFSTYGLEYRADTNKISATLNTANDNTAKKITLSTTQTLFTDKKKTTAWITELAYADNKAEGSDQTYSRYDLGATYLMPAGKDASMTTKIGYYTVNYSTHSAGRRDDDFALTLGWSKPISSTWSASASANYTLNNSTNDNNAYNKYSVTGTLSWNDSF